MNRKMYTSGAYAFKVVNNKYALCVGTGKIIYMLLTHCRVPNLKVYSQISSLLGCFSTASNVVYASVFGKRGFLKIYLQLKDKTVLIIGPYNMHVQRVERAGAQAIPRKQIFIGV